MVFTSEDATGVRLAAAESGSGPYIVVNYGSPTNDVRNVVATAPVSSEVRATWEPPLGVGATSYIVTLLRASDRVQVATKTCEGCLQAVFTGVVNRVEYVVEVRASNVYGVGPAATSNRVTPTITILGGPVVLGDVRGGRNDAAPHVQCTQKNVKEPINTATGVFWHTFDDLFIPGRGIPLSLSHSYSSDAASIANDGPLGHGWSYTYGMSLSFADPPDDTHPWANTVTVRQETGSEAVFELNTTLSTYGPAAKRVDATLVRSDAGGQTSYVVTRRSTEILVFDGTGRLTELRDLNDHATRLSRPDPNTTVVTEPAGRTLTLSFSGGHLQTVTDSSLSPARTVRFRYTDGQNNLNEVVDVTGGVTSFTYDGAHRLKTMRFPKYHGDTTTTPAPVVTNEYLADGKVAWQSDEVGRRTRFDYAPAGEPPGSVKVTDAKDNAVLYRYDQGALVSMVRGYGTPSAATWFYDYDAATLGCTKTTDPNGHARGATYDARGNKRTETDALNRTTTWTYNGVNQVATVTDAEGVETRFEYDGSWGAGAGNLTAVKTPLKDAAGATVATRTTRYNYLENGHPHRGDVTSIVDPNQAGVTTPKKWRFGYDAWGNQDRVTNPLGHTTTAVFDAAGRKRTEVSARGNVAGADPAQYTTTYQYEADNLLSQVTDPLGHVATRHYDANRNLDWVLDADQRKTTFEFNPANELTVTTRGAGTADAVTKRTEYWPDGSVWRQRDGANQATTYTYDAHGRPATMTDPLARTTTFGYDGVGNLVTKADHGGNCGPAKVSCTTFSYDAADQLSGIDYSFPNTPDVTNVRYDKMARRIEMTDGTGTSRWTWDSLGRLTSSTSGAASPGGSQQVLYGYKLGGELERITYPGGTDTVERGFDDAGRMEWVEDWLGNRTTFGHDEDDNLKTTTLPAATGVTDSYSYDSAGRLDDIALRRGGVEFAGFGYGRDGAGQVTSATATGVAPDDHTYGYSSRNQLCWVGGGGQAGTCAAPPAGATRYAYDDADNPTTFAGATRAFNPASELCWSVPGGSTNPCGSPPGGATTFEYDARGNRTKASPPASAASTFAYDQANRLISAQAHPAAPASPSGMLRVSTVPAVPSQIVVDGVPRDTWGLTWADIEPGPHTVCFRDVVGYTTPGCQTVSVEAGSVTTVVGTFLQRGTLKVATSPAVPATITVDGQPRNDWGMWTDLPANRTYRVCFGAVADHAPPPCQDVVLAPGVVREVTGTYTPSAGAAGPSGHGYLRVTTNPAVASQIVVDGVPRDSWGLTWVKFAPGAHTVCFTDIDGYTTPACQSIEVTAGATTEVQGSFVQRGVIKVETSPPVPATVTIDGIARNNWAVWTDLPAGGYQVCFGQVAAHVAPPCRYVTLTPGATTTVTGTYDAPTTYAYNGDGLRMSRSTAGATTSFTWDLAQGLPLLLSEGTAASATRYIYGPDNLPLAEVSPSGRVLYHHHDHLGSRALTDAAGTVVTTATYDAYGSLASSTGLGRTSFGFAGEYTDAETGFVYLRARYYDPGTGQFLTRDPIEAVTREAYGYVGGNPLNRTDPLGLFPGQGLLKKATDLVQTVTTVVEVGALVVAAGAAVVPGGQLVAGGALIVAGGAGGINTAATCAEYAALGGSRSDCLTSFAVDVGTAGIGRLVTPGAVKKGKKIYTAAERGIQAGVNLTGEFVDWAIGYDPDDDYGTGRIDCNPIPRFEARR